MKFPLIHAALGTLFATSAAGAVTPLPLVKYDFTAVTSRNNIAG